MTIKRKFLHILENKGVSEYKFYKEAGVSRGTLANSSGLNEDTIVKFFNYFPDVDANLIFKQNISPITYDEQNADNFDTAEELLPNTQLSVDKDKSVEDLQAELIKFQREKIADLERRLLKGKPGKETGS